MSSPSRCRFCDHENPNDARFCNACGSPLHLKPCPRCESVNDVAAEQCYECGASLDTAAPVETGQATSASAAATPITAAFENAVPRHVPEAFGERLGDIPPLEGHENLTAAERRDAFMRRSRVSAAAFALLVLIVIGAFGYYTYQQHAGSEPDVVATSGQNDDQPPPGEPRQTPTSTSESANAATEPEQAPTSPSESAPPVGTPNAQATSSNVSTSDAAPEAKSVGTQSDAQTPSLNDAKPSTNAKANARNRASAPRSSNKGDLDPHSRPAPATDASAQATQRMIERYLGTRAGTSTQRSNPY
jgi:hypothetical protein